jgi:hypothetical protein
MLPLRDFCKKRAPHRVQKPTDTVEQMAKHIIRDYLQNTPLLLTFPKDNIYVYAEERLSCYSITQAPSQSNQPFDEIPR